MLNHPLEMRYLSAIRALKWNRYEIVIENKMHLLAIISVERLCLGTKMIYGGCLLANEHEISF